MNVVYLWKNRVRHTLFSRIWLKQWLKRGYHVFSLLRLLSHRFSLERRGAKIGILSIISNKCKIQGSPKQISVGNYSFIGKAYITTNAHISIGSHVAINDGVQILTASHIVNDPKWATLAKPIVINDFAWIATNAIILPGVNIGKGAVIGAGAVVTKNIPDYRIAVGNPAKLTNKSREKELSYNPVELIACYEAWLGKEIKVYQKDI
ncbi:acyltransferase [Picosynechococcus sp. PCC 73109]|uniref:acyltransferase n=1 Tax=Picosynechococcus sp. PCC 73109 TaxID=374982 RepID=UPI000745808B|nr:acyltransferase [Picosynechococcus sp. PCC 73109]AMA09217.1 hypothetical protein AWQ23_07750 [Picosynechococcus sp. PCC 73109]